MKVKSRKYQVLSILVTLIALGTFFVQGCNKHDAPPQDPNLTMQLTDEALQGGENGTINAKFLALVSEAVLHLGMGDVEIDNERGDEEQYTRRQNDRTLEQHTGGTYYQLSQDIQLLPEPLLAHGSVERALFSCQRACERPAGRHRTQTGFQTGNHPAIA